MRLSDLVERRDLSLRVLHAPDGSLERSVRWVYTTDLPDPSRYLSGGELVISGLVWRRPETAEEDGERFVAAVAASGAAALVAGEAVFGEVPADVVDACRRHGLVLLGVPVDVSFGAVTEVVVGTLAAARGDRLAHTLGRQRQLLTAVAGGAGLDELAARVSAGTGLTCRVLTAGGRLLGGPPLPGTERDAAVAAYLTAERLPAELPGGHTVVPVGPGTSRVTGWFVLASAPGPDERDGGAGTAGRSGDPAAAWDEAATRDEATARPDRDNVPRDAAPESAGTFPRSEPREGARRSSTTDRQRRSGGETVDAVAELAAVAALDRTRRREGLSVARPIADDAIARIAIGEGDRPETRVRLRQAGIEPDGRLTVLVLRTTGPTDPAATAYSMLIDALDPDVAAAVGVQDGAAVALIAPCGPGSPADLAVPAGPSTAPPDTTAPDTTAPDTAAVADPLDDVLDALHRLGPGLGTWRVHVGVARPVGADALTGAYGEAVHAAGLAATRAGPVTVVRAGELTSHVALLAGVPDEVRREFAAAVLGPVLEHDTRSGTGLCATLDAFLDEAGSWSRTAARLHLHVNTVRYRIGRVEELTGRDLGHFPDRVDLYLALRSR